MYVVCVCVRVCVLHMCVYDRVVGAGPAAACPKFGAP